jgi:DNA polymerase-1
MQRILFLDIETDGLDATQIFVCVTKDKETGEVRYHTRADTFNNTVEDYDIVVGHNILSFDAPYLNKLWKSGLTVSKIQDTYILSCLFNPDREGRHSLEAWGQRLGLGKINYKDFTHFNPEMLEYCENDVHITHKVYDYLMSTEKKDFSDKSITLEHKIRHVLNKQESKGFYLNTEKAHKLMMEVSNKAEEIESSVLNKVAPRAKLIREVVPKIKKDGTLSSIGLKNIDKNIIGGPFSVFEYEKFNLASPKQIIERLDQYGWSPIEFTPKGSPKISEKNLETISPSAPEEIKRLAEWKMLKTRAKTIESWLEVVDNNSRVHGKVITMGAVTGRMVHADPNMANIVANHKPYGGDSRSCWTVPDDNHVLVGMDAKGLELRMLAHYMKDEPYIHEVLEGDPHTYNQELAELPNRNAAKTFIYAFIYGAGNQKIGSIVNGSQEDGRKLREKFLSNLPKLDNLIQSVQKHSSRGYIRGIDGRRILIRRAHAALNTLLQGGGAICCKQWAIFLDEEIQRRKLRAYLVNTIHDEQQYEVHMDDAEELVSIADLCMTRVSNFFQMNIPLNADAKIGRTWQETH